MDFSPEEIPTIYEALAFGIQAIDHELDDIRNNGMNPVDIINFVHLRDAFIAIRNRLDDNS